MTKTGTLFIFFIAISFALLCTTSKKRRRRNKNKYKDCLNPKRYDYIVVGAGSAGSALAAKLATESSSTVLLIEEGGWSSQWGIIDDASKGFDVLRQSQINPGYITIPQTGANNRIMTQSRGKITGGSGSIYFMDWVFANIKDFDERWNIPDWRWKDISPYWDTIRNEWDITINDPAEIIFRDELINSLKQSNYEYNPDFNDLNKNGQGGFSEMQFAAAKLSPTLAQRLNSWKIYVEPLLGVQHNLDILVYTRVNRILFDKYRPRSRSYSRRKTIKATGVEIYGIGDNEVNIIYAQKEVIICAGTLDTPKILLLSGVGNCDELKIKNIDCVKNVNGVGKNLQDDFQFVLTSPPLKESIANNINLPKNIYSYLNEQAMIIFDDNGDYEHVFWLTNFTNPESFNMLTYVQHPISRGEITLFDNDPNSRALINPNYLGSDVDKAQMVEALRIGRDFLYGDSMLPLYKDESSEFEISPGDDLQTDDELVEWGINNFFDGAHQVGTSKMGINFDDDDMMVVNNRLKLRDIEHLRIADCSIIPEVVSGHTNQIAVLIGLKAADIILEDG